MNAQLDRTTNLMNIFIENSARMIDMQLEATRTLLETNAKNAAVFGVPDISAAFSNQNDINAGELYQKTVEHVLGCAKQIGGSYNEMQSHWNRLIQKQTEQWMENVKQGIHSTTCCIQEGIQGATETAKRAVDEMDAQLQQVQQQAKEHGAEAAKRITQSVRSRESVSTEAKRDQ